MAKGARATTVKRNKRNLRAQFAPAHDARLERLSAKLQEVAAKPKPEHDTIMSLDSQEGKGQHIDLEEAEDSQTEGMDLDMQGAKQSERPMSSKKKSPNKIEKKSSRRKAKHSMVFAPTMQQKRRMEGKGRKK